jgi:hypothetical protein
MKHFYNICFVDENDYPALVSGHEDVAHADKVMGPNELADQPDD